MNLPASAGDGSLIPDLGRPTCPVYDNYWACALEPRSPNYCSPNALEPVLCNRRSHQNEKFVHRNSRAAPTHHNYRKACAATKTQHTHTQTECAPQVCLTLALWSLNHLRMNTNSIYHSFQFTTCARHKTSLFHLICIITPWGRSYTSHSTHDKTEKAKGVVWIITGSR